MGKDHDNLTSEPYDDPHEVTLDVNDEDFEEEAFWTNHIKLNKRHFFSESWRNIDGQWTFWVYAMGSKKDCKRFTYTINFFSTDKDKKGKLVYQNYCVPLDLSKEQVARNGDCLTLTDAAAKRFWVNGTIKFKVIIEAVD